MRDIKIKRAELEAKAFDVQSELTQEIDDIRLLAKERGKQILIAGGILAGSYVLYSIFSSKKKSIKFEKEEVTSFAGAALKSFAIGLALSYAKDQLIDYLNRMEEKTDKIEP